MIHWCWAIFALFAGVVFGMFLFAFLEVSREMEREQKQEVIDYEDRE